MSEQNKKRSLENSPNKNSNKKINIVDVPFTKIEFLTTKLRINDKFV